MITSLLERRRREARAFDDVQRQAEERASQALVSKPRVVVTPPATAPMSDEDRLSTLLLGDTQRLATIADLHAVIAYFDEQLADLRADLESAETGYEPL